jgi:hypothetical protein
MMIWRVGSGGVCHLDEKEKHDSSRTEMKKRKMVQEDTHTHTHLFNHCAKRA